MGQIRDTMIVESVTWLAASVSTELVFHVCLYCWWAPNPEPSFWLSVKMIGSLDRYPEGAVIEEKFKIM